MSENFDEWDDDEDDSIFEDEGEDESYYEDEYYE